MICIQLLRTFYPHWGWHSGINQYLRFLDDRRFAVQERLVPDSDEAFPVRQKLLRKLTRSTVQMRGMAWYKLSDLRAEMDAWKSCRCTRTDIVHYLDGEHSAQYLPVLKRFLGRAKPRILATYHQPPELLDALIHRDVISSLDGVTVVSPEQYAYFREYLGYDKVRLILHGIDTDFFKPADIRNNGEVFKCLTVGHYLRDFNAIKRVAGLLCGHDSIQFHIVSSRADGLECLENVRVYRGIQDEQLLELYQSADLMLLPLLKATANNSLLEGIACGLPVLSTALADVRAYVPGGEAILVENNDAERLAEAILHLADNPEIRRDMGRRARQRAEQLDWRHIARQYEAVYTQLMY